MARNNEEEVATDCVTLVTQKNNEADTYGMLFMGGRVCFVVRRLLWKTTGKRVSGSETSGFSGRSVSRSRFCLWVVALRFSSPKNAAWW